MAETVQEEDEPAAEEEGDEEQGEGFGGEHMLSVQTCGHCCYLSVRTQQDDISVWSWNQSNDD